MDRLEERLGTKLFVRLQTGLVLTEEGAQILKEVTEMEQLSFNVYRRAARVQPHPSPAPFIAARKVPALTDIPKLIDFQNTYRQLVVDLRCAMEQADVSRLEADIAIQFERPKNPDLIVTKLGRLHIYPFASESYQRTYGLPTSKEDWKNHRVIRQVAPQVDDSVYARIFEIDLRRHHRNAREFQHGDALRRRARGRHRPVPELRDCARRAARRRRCRRQPSAWISG